MKPTTHKSTNNKHRKDIIIGFIIGVIALLYFTGTPGDVLLNLIMACLLIAAIGYVIIYPLVDTFKEFRSFREFRRIVKLKQSTEEIDTMSWQEFEIFVAKWLKDEGYTNVQMTEYYDLGVDIIAEKDGIKWGVQVKHYLNMVKIEAIRQVVPALKYYKCDKAMVVTNSFFSRPAIQLAASHECVLIDGIDLRRKIKVL